jgi:hypothetical protein
MKQYIDKDGGKNIMLFRKQEQIIRIVISGIIIIILGIVAIVKNNSQEKNIQPVNTYIQESSSK